MTVVDRLCVLVCLLAIASTGCGGEPQSLRCNPDEPCADPRFWCDTSMATDPAGICRPFLDGAPEPPPPSGPPTITPIDHDFGEVIIGSESALFTFSASGLMSTSGATHATLSVTDDTDNSFLVNADSCLSPTGRVCEVLVRFRPSKSGRKRAKITIGLQAGGAPVGSLSVQVFGTAPEPALLYIPPGYDFGGFVRGTGGNGGLTVYNLGGSPLTITSAILSDSTNFLLENNCAGPIMASQSCGLSLRFIPSVLGPITSEVMITTTAGSRTVLISGTGLPPAQLTVSANAIDFGNELIGNMFIGTLQVGNSGFSTTGPIAVSLTDSSGSYTVDSSRCTELFTQSQCTILVTFRPAQGGPKNATLSVSAATGGSFSIPLSGVGYGRVSITVPSGLNTGFVTASPGGFNSNNSQTWTFYVATAVLSATPNPGYRLVSLCGQAAAVCSVPITAATTAVTAVFESIP